MTAELRHTRRQHTITDVYEITDIERAESWDFGDIKPATVSVQLDFDDGKWTLTWLTIKGPMYKHNGELGVRWLDHLYSERQLTDAPDWAQELVRQSFREAEGPTPVTAMLPTGPDVEPATSSMIHRMTVCRECSESSEWFRDPPKDSLRRNEKVHFWNQAHSNETGHSSFWTFEVGRATDTIYMV